MLETLIHPDIHPHPHTDNVPSGLLPRLDAIRADFPILSSTVHGKPLVYLDNAASAQKPRAMLEALAFAYTHTYANVHRGLYDLANRATEAFEEARAKLARHLGAAHAEQIVFTRSATEAINLVASSFGEHHLREGDEIVLSIMEHHANIVPWHFWREKRGVVLRFVDILEDGSLDMASFENALSQKTKLVAITHMSNVLGTITPLAQIVACAHAHGIPVLVDGAQGAVHCAPDVQKLGVDFYVVTGHKLYGPTGIGALYAKDDWLDRLPPYQGGGEMIELVTCDTVTYNCAPHRFEAGTPPIAEAIALGATLDYLDTFDKGALAEHEAALAQRALSRLSVIKGIRVLGQMPGAPPSMAGKGAILSFVTQGHAGAIHAHDLATYLDRYGIAVRAGTHCAMPLHQRLGITASCRASFALYNTPQEVEYFADCLEKALAFFCKQG